MAKTPYSAVVGTGIANQVGKGAGTPVSRTVSGPPKDAKNTARTASANHTPTGRSVAGNW